MTIFTYYVYILQNLQDKTLYTGYTNNITTRQLQHDLKQSKYTARKGQFKMVFHCVFHGEKAKEKAQAFEKYLKSGSGRAFIKRHILNNN